MNILITGGSRGIGLAIARRLAGGGHRLLLTGRDPQALEGAREELDGSPLTFAGDLGQPDTIEGLAAHMDGHGFLPDVLLLNAAAFFDATRSVITPPVQELERLVQVNLFANYRLVSRLLPLLRQSACPRIVLIGSTACLRQDSSLYAISKAALRSYGKGLREELKPLGVGVTLLHPGGTFTERRAPDAQTPPGRLLEADDIARLIEAVLALSPQAVVEELSVRPLLGDTF